MLKVHFLNVGHGDCTIIEHPSGRLTMIDINNSQNSDQDTFGELVAEEREKMHRRALAASTILGGGGLLGSALVARPSIGMLTELLLAVDRAKNEITDPVDFMLRNYPNRRLWRYANTHPDLDHMRGIKRLHEKVGFENFWDTANTKPTPNFRSDTDKDDWNCYQRLRSGGAGTIRHLFTRGDRYFAFNMDEYGLPGGDNIEILSPTSAIVNHANSNQKFNNSSIVLRVSHANHSILLPGDVEETVWKELQRVYGILLKSTFLKASHHGRDTGYHLPALRLIQPAAVVVSVGRKPTTDAHQKYCAQCGNVYSTRYYGNLTLEIQDNGNCRWIAQRNGS